MTLLVVPAVLLPPLVFAIVVRLVWAIVKVAATMVVVIPAQIAIVLLIVGSLVPAVKLVMKSVMAGIIGLTSSIPVLLMPFIVFTF